MRRRYIVWHIAALMMVAVGCGTESAPTLSSPPDAGVGADTIADLDVSSPDTSTQDSLPGVDGGSKDSWTDVPGAPELPPVFVDCDVVQELECGDLVEEASNGGEGSTQVIGWYACQPEVKTQYAASPEKTYRFTADKHMWVTVKETSPTSIDLFSVREVVQALPGQRLRLSEG